MRKLPIADGRGVVEIRRRRAVVRVAGRYVGTVVKDGGRWALPGEHPAYGRPVDAAEALADASGWDRAA